MDNDHPRARLYYLFGTTGNPHDASWLARLPVGLFAISVGLFGLVGAWRRAADYGWQPAADVSDVLIWPVTALWALSLLLYGFKCKRHPQAVLREFRHPVQGSLQALAPLSILLAVTLFHRSGQGVWLVLALLALGLNAVIALRVVSILATGRLPGNAVTPALYLPVVGGALIGGMTLASLEYSGLAALLFGAGLSGWALLEVRVLGRLFEGPMAESLRATIGVELMPPLIATMSAGVIWPDLPADALVVGLGIAAGPSIGVLARYRWWFRAPFSIGFWSFSFPLAALASAAIEAVHRGGWPQWIGHAVLLASSAVITLLALRTVALLLRREWLSGA